MKYFFIPLFLSLFFSSVGSAKDLHLFSRSGIASLDYYQAHSETRRGDRFIFSDGQSYEIDRLLGCGQTTCIYGLLGSPDKAIRIPKYYGLLKRTREDTAHTRDFINAFIRGKKELSYYKVPSVEIYGGNENEYIIVERIHSMTDLHQFLMNPFSFTNLDRIQMENDLIQFAKATAQFKNIGDFHSRQLHYVRGRGWLLLDWTEHHELNRPGDLNLKSENTFDAVFYENDEIIEKMTKLFPHSDEQWLRQLAKQIKNIIITERRSMASKNIPTNRCFSFFKPFSKIAPQ